MVHAISVLGKWGAVWAKMPRWFVLCRRRRRAQAGKAKKWWGHQPSKDQHPHHQETVGSALLSHNPSVAVPSAQKGLTSRFGKDTGCNPLAKTTNTTKTSNTPKKEVITHQSVKQYIHLTTQPLKAVLVVNRTVDANTPKNKPPTKTSR